MLCPGNFFSMDFFLLHTFPSKERVVGVMEFRIKSGYLFFIPLFFCGNFQETFLFFTCVSQIPVMCLTNWVGFHFLLIRMYVFLTAYVDDDTIRFMAMRSLNFITFFYWRWLGVIFDDTWAKRGSHHIRMYKSES